MNKLLDSASNITHVRGLYSFDESVPISKFVYKKDRSYLQDYRKKKNANKIRRDCFRTMNYFEPTYYVKMMEYQQIQEKAKFKYPSQIPFSISIKTLAKNSEDLQCPRFSRYSNSRNMFSSSLSWLPSSLNSPPTPHAKKKSQKSKTRNSTQRKGRSKSVSTSRNCYYYGSSNMLNTNNYSYSPNNSHIKTNKDYKREEREVSNLLLKRYFQKWIFNWCGKNSLMMSQMKVTH